MTREYDRQMLESITQSFTKDQATEFSRRIQAVHTLLDRVSPKCEELASEIRKRREAEKSSRYFLAFLLITVVVLLILRSLSVVNYDAFFFFPAFGFLFAVATMQFAPEGPNPVAISTLKILTFTLITRIEELGVSEKYVFLWVKKVASLDASLLREIRESYLSSEHSDEDYETISGVERGDESELDDEVDEPITAWRIRLEIARAVVRCLGSSGFEK